ncbi:MAG: polyhydroxyalkanoate depolymerase [Rhodospirillaceae bacterium]
MLYQAYEMQQAALGPMRLWADAVQDACRNPFMAVVNPGFGRAASAAAEMFERSTRRYGKPEFGITETVINGLSVAVVEAVVAEKPFCRLLHFQRAANRDDPRVLLLAPLAGNHATLLRGTVEALLPGHDVYITDWVDACQVPLGTGPFGLDDNVAYIMDFMRLLGPDTHVVAVCQPSVTALAAVSLLAQDDDINQPRSLTLIGGPIDVTVAPTMPSRLAKMNSVDWFERTVIAKVPACYPGAGRRVFPGFVQLSGFMSMNLERHALAHYKMYQDLIEDDEAAATQKTFYDEYMSVMDLSADFYLETVASVFQRHDLPNGTMSWRGRNVQPSAIHSTALMTIEGERDDISAPGQTSAAHGLTINIPSARRSHHLQVKVGHLGLFTGRRWRGEVLPKLAEFIAAHR